MVNAGRYVRFLVLLPNHASWLSSAFHRIISIQDRHGVSMDVQPVHRFVTIEGEEQDVVAAQVKSSRLPHLNL